MASTDVAALLGLEATVLVFCMELRRWNSLVLAFLRSDPLPWRRRLGRPEWRKSGEYSSAKRTEPGLPWRFTDSSERNELLLELALSREDDSAEEFELNGCSPLAGGLAAAGMDTG